MRNFLATALIAATALPLAAIPTTASAQSRAEVRDSYRDLKEERRDLKRAYRYGDKRDIKRERRDVRRAKKEYARDLKDYRKAQKRRHHYAYKYQRSNWRAPFAYHSWDRGARINPRYYHARYTISDHYRMPRASRNMRWVRHYDDALLINIRTGRVIDVQRNYFW